MPTAESSDEPRVTLVRAGLALGTQTLPLYAGSVHYWRHDTAAWRPALEAIKALGLRLVDTYVPWGVHELSAGEFDFGEQNPCLNVAAFLRTAAEVGLYAIVRPGPHINAELTWFGIPERVIWDAECQARSARGKPVILPVPPLAFPVPSYASEAFQAEVAEWLAAFGGVVSPLVWPDGPIVLYQVDNEGAMYFRDGVYDQDYHPDALNHYRRFLQSKYPSLENLRAAHGDPSATFAKLEAPRRLVATTALELAPHLDWAEFQENLLADSFARMQRVLKNSALGRVPSSHNLPLSEGATPLDPQLIGRTVDLVGLDYYHGASPPQRSEILRRTSELAARCNAQEKPAFACELGAGFPPFFPALREEDNMFTTLAALAYGLRGFNVYMAVERDRWIGSPIDRTGQRRASARFWEQLITALERTQFCELSRRTPVHLVIPRSYRRLTRVLHAFGPLSAALFQVFGGTAEQACFEDELGLQAPVVMEAQRFVRALEVALEGLRIPYSVVSGDLIGHALDTAHWTILICTGALEPEIAAAINSGIERGRNITVGPFAPERDHLMRPLDSPLSLLRPPNSAVPTLLGLDAQAIDRSVRDAAERLKLTRIEASPNDIFVALHEHASGRPAVLFVINPGNDDREARVAAHGALAATDCLSAEQVPASRGAFELRVSARSVRMLELSQLS